MPPSKRNVSLSQLRVGIFVLIAIGVLVISGRRWSLALLCLPTVLTTLVVASESWSLFHTHGGKLVAIQGRYLYVGLTGLGVVAAAGLKWQTIRFATH